MTTTLDVLRGALKTTVTPDDGAHGRGPMVSERLSFFIDGKGYPSGGLWTPDWISATPRVEECMTSLSLWYSVTATFATGDEAREFAAVAKRAWRATR